MVNKLNAFSRKKYLLKASSHNLYIHSQVMIEVGFITQLNIAIECILSGINVNIII